MVPVTIDDDVIEDSREVTDNLAQRVCRDRDVGVVRLERITTVHVGEEREVHICRENFGGGARAERERNII